jgi:hypothetical protein
MNHRFRPPPLAVFYPAADADLAVAESATRDLGFAEGHAQGLREGHEAGFVDGAAEARAALQPELDALRDASAKRDRRVGVANALREVLAARDNDVAALERETREIAAAALETLFPTLLAAAAGAEVAAFLANALSERAPAALTLRAHPETLATIETETAIEREAGRLTVEAVPGMPFGAAEAAWSGGGITFDPTALLARVTSILAASVPLPSTQSPKAPQ